MMSVMAQFKDQEHHVVLLREIEFERDRQIRLNSQAALLDKQVFPSVLFSLDIDVQHPLCRFYT